MRVPPVPIPNTEVKPHSAESTWLATAWEDRSSPVFCFWFLAPCCALAAGGFVFIWGVWDRVEV